MHTAGDGLLTQPLNGVAVSKTLAAVVFCVTACFRVLISDNFVFEEPDCSSRDTLVAAAALGGLVYVCRFIVMACFSVSVNFVFVSPDGSASPPSFRPAGARSVHIPLRGGLRWGTITGSLIRSRKAAQAKMTMRMRGLSAPYAAVLKRVVRLMPDKPESCLSGLHMMLRNK
jgi:hypothetical protein